MGTPAPLTTAQPVQELLDASKTQEGRQRLLSTGQLAAAAQEAVHALSQWESLVVAADSGNDQQQVALRQTTLQLRLLRNCCALGAAAATLLLQHDVQQGVAAGAANVASSCCGTQQRQQQQCGSSSHAATPQLSDLLTAAVQFLHNLSATGPQGAAAVWSALFPAALDSLLLVDDGRVHEAAALTCLSCVRSSSQALQELTSSTARSAWCSLLAPLTPQHQAAAGPLQLADAADTAHTALQAGQPEGLGVVAAGGPAAAAALAVPPGNDNLCLLVKYVAMQHSRLQALMQLLAPQQPDTTAANSASSKPAAAAAVPFAASEWQAVLLHVVAVEAAGVPAASPLPGVPIRPAHSSSSSSDGQQSGSSGEADWLQHAVQLLQEVWSVTTAAAAPTAGVCSKPTAAAHVLEALLHVLRAVLARDEDTEGGKSGKEAEAAAAAGLAAVAQYLHSLGLVQQLLQMLTALGPPPKNKQQQQRELEQQQQGQVQGQGQPPQQQQQQPPQPQHQQPYAGYRADVVAVLSNVLLGGREVQADVMAAGGIELLLNSCNLDDTAPMAREWALWGIRNACQGNEAVQQYVSQFQAVDAVQSPELDKMGMQLELDQMTHKLKLTKKPGGQVDCTVEKD